MKAKRDYLSYIFAAFLAVCTVLITVAVFRGSLATLHSDTAIAPLLAKEQLITGQLIPSTWYYAYEYWILDINLLILPFLKITNNMMLSKQIAVVLQTILLEAATYGYLKRVTQRKWALLGCILVISPLSFLQMEHFYFQATYATTSLFAFLILLLADLFFENNSLKKEMIWGVLLSALIIALGGGGIRTLGTVVLPLLGGLGLSALIHAKFHPLHLLKDKRTLIKIIVVGAAALGSILFGNALTSLGQTHGTNEMAIITYDQLIDRLHQFVTSFLQVYGCFEGKMLMTPAGVMGLFKLFLALLSGIIVPVVLILRFPKLKKGQQIYLTYSVLSFVVIAYMMIFCNLTNSYYFLPIFVNNMALICIFIDHFQKDILRILLWGVFCVLLPISLYSCRFYAKYPYENIEKWAHFNTVDIGLLEFLQSEGLTFGFSDFFNAQAYTVASNGAVEIVSVEEHHARSEITGTFVSYLRRPHDARKWLSSSRWYQPDYHTGESFILVLTEFLTDIEKQYFDQADRILTYNQYSIVVLPENLMSYPWK